MLKDKQEKIFVHPIQKQQRAQHNESSVLSRQSDNEHAFSSFHNHLGNQSLQNTLEGTTSSLFEEHYFENAVMQLGGVQSASEQSNTEQMGVLARKKSAQKTEQKDANPIVSNLLKQSGRPLPEAIQKSLEKSFGSTLDHVRIHTNDQAHQAAKAVQAVAFASGTDIVFSQGAFDTTSKAGQELIAHEVAHVLQFDTGRMGQASQTVNGVGVSTPSDATEREADSMASSFVESSAQDSVAPTESEHASTATGHGDLVMRKPSNSQDEDEPIEEETPSSTNDKDKDKDKEKGKDKEKDKEKEGTAVEGNVRTSEESNEAAEGGEKEGGEEEEGEKEGEKEEGEETEAASGEANAPALPEDVEGDAAENGETTSEESQVEGEGNQATVTSPPVAYATTPTLRYTKPKIPKEQADKIKKEKGTHPTEAFGKITKKAEEIATLATNSKSTLISEITSAESTISNLMSTQLGGISASYTSASGKITGSFETAKSLLDGACSSAIATSQSGIETQKTQLDSTVEQQLQGLEATFTSIEGQLKTVQESAPANVIADIDAESSKFDDAYTSALPKLQEMFTTAIAELPNGSELEKVTKEITQKGLQKKSDAFAGKGAEQKEKYKSGILGQHKTNAAAIVNSIIAPLNTEIATQYQSIKGQITGKKGEAVAKFESESNAVEGTITGVKTTAMQSIEKSKTSSLTSVENAQNKGTQALENAGSNLIENLRKSTQQFGAAYDSQIEGIQPLMDQASNSPDLDSMMPQLEKTEESIKQSAISHDQTIQSIIDSAQTSLQDTGSTYKKQIDELGESTSSQINSLAGTKKASIETKATSIVQKAQGLSQDIRTQIQTFSDSMKEKAQAAEAKSVSELDVAKQKMLSQIGEAVGKQKDLLTQFAQESITSAKTAGATEGQSKMTELYTKSTGLFNAMEGMGTNEGAIFGHLRGLTPVQGSVLRSIYTRQTNRSLDSDLKSELDDAMTIGDGQWRRAQYALNGDAANAAKLALKQSLGFFNDDEATIKAELRSLSDTELQKLQQMATTDSETKKIIADVRSSLGGEDLDIANTFLNATTDGSGKILLPDVEALNLKADAIEIFHAMDGMGTDEEKVYKGLEGKSAEQREAIQKAYLSYAKEKFAQDNNMSPNDVKDGQVMNLKEKIKDDFSFSGDGKYFGKDYQGDIALGLLDGDAVAVKAAKLEKASDGWFFGAGTDEKEILTQLKDSNLKEPPPLGDNPTPEQIQEHQQKTEAYKKASADREALQKKYAERYGRSIESMIESEMGGDKDDYMGELARQTLKSGDGERSLKLKAATDGIGTNEDLIKEALQDSSGNPLPKEELKALQKQYADAGYGNLMQDLESDLSGKEKFDVDILMMGKPTTPAEFQAIANKKYEYQRSGFSGAYMDMMGATGYYNSPEVFDYQKQQLDKKIDQWSMDTSKAGKPQDPNKPPAIPKDLNEAYGFFNDGFESYESAKMEVAEGTGTAVAIVGAVALTVATGGGASPALVGVLAGAGMSTTAATATAVAIGAMGTSALGALSKAAIMGNSYGSEALMQDVASIGIEGLTAGGGKYLQVLAAQGKSVKYLQPLINLYGKSGQLTGPGSSMSQKVAGNLLESLPENLIKEMFAATTNEKNWDNDTVLQDFLLRMSASAGGSALGTVFNEAGGNIYSKLNDNLEGGNVFSKAVQSPVFKDQLEDAFKNMGSSIGKEATTELLNFVSDPQAYEKDFASVFTTMMKNAGINVSKGVVTKAIDQFKSSFNKTMPVLEMILKNETDTPKFQKLADELTPQQKNHLATILLLGNLSGAPDMSARNSSGTDVSTNEP